MTSLLDKENNYYLGVDGGGSKCKAIVTSADGQVAGVGVSGPANPLHGMDKSVASIIDASQQAIADAGLAGLALENVVAGIGLAGVNLPWLFQQVQSWHHPFKQMYLTTDLDIANIGANDGSEGAVIIVGTGSCGYSCAGGKKVILGGHGFPIGDIGSGAWMGLKAVQHTLLVLDGFEKSSRVSESVCEVMGINNALALSEKVAGRSSRQYAKLASVIFASEAEGDFVAKAIVAEGVSYIVSMSETLLKNKPKRICMIGGLAKFILPRMPHNIAAQFVEPIAQPEIGALTFAQQNWQDKHKQSA